MITAERCGAATQSTATVLVPAAERPTTIARPLIIGYGNPLRTDDGVGWQVAARLAADPRAAGIDVIAAHQLAPEYAEDLHAASLVVLVDAQLDGHPPPAPGACTIRQILPRAGAATGGWTHHRTPSGLAALARDLYGSVPPVRAVGVGVASLGPGDRLSPQVDQALPAIADLVLRLATRATNAHLYPPVKEQEHA